MTSFEKRLQKAIERGQRASDARALAETQKALSEQELRRLHTQYRLKLSDHIEECLKKLADQLPGFDFDPVVAERGWGAAVSHEEMVLAPGRRRPASRFSRLEMVVRPLSSSYVLELAAKGTVHNKELFNRSHYQLLSQIDPSSFTNLVDLWVLEYAELYAAKT